jgi:hypothetical protein
VSNSPVDQLLPDEELTDGELCWRYQCKTTERIAAITENNTPAKSQALSPSAELRMLTSGSRLAVSRLIPATDDHKNHTAKDYD